MVIYKNSEDPYVKLAVGIVRQSLNDLCHYKKGQLEINQSVYKWFENGWVFEYLEIDGKALRERYISNIKERKSTKYYGYNRKN